eukprot:COSAG02_NODE_42056_length_388_cov_0.892734_1_plen_96_part_10
MGRTGDFSRDRRKLADAKRPIKRLLLARVKTVMAVSSVSGNTLHQFHLLFAYCTSDVQRIRIPVPYCTDSVIQKDHTHFAEHHGYLSEYDPARSSR